MHKLKQTIHMTILYISTVVLVAGVPMAAYADKSDACIAINRKGKNWVTNPDTGECVKASTLPTVPAVSPEPEASPEPTATPDPATSAQQVTPSNDSTDTVNTNVNASSETDINNDNDIATEVDATSQSGNAVVNGNQSAGNAGSGDANAVATVVNSVHSTVDGGTGIAHFTADINGNVTGDITLGPTIDNLNVNSNTNLNGTTNIDNNTNLTNDVTLNAQSGDATVRGNESTGSATSGNANTVADVLNLINTIIAANKSFIGTINIYGNLDGDILISPEFIPQLLASNANVTSNYDMTLSTNINDDQSIVNNVKLNAASGDASVRGNGTSGSATSGMTDTNLTILNLTGHEVNAKNSLLVFINVLGTWVGMIIDAPGASAAAFGNGVIESNINASAQTNINNTAGITNNIDLTSQSGDATVAGNQSQGSAASGNATASANIANISKSTFNLSDWFGVLYINVFGSWNGWFLKDTAAGTITPIGGMAVPEKSGAIASPGLQFGFTPKKAAAVTTPALASPAVAAASSSGDDDYNAAVLASAIVGEAQDKKEAQTLKQAMSPREDPFSLVMMIAGFGVAGVSGAVWLVRRLF